MKKISTILLAASASLLILVMTACSGGSAAQTSQADPGQTASGGGLINIFGQNSLVSPQTSSGASVAQSSILTPSVQPSVVTPSVQPSVTTPSSVTTNSAIAGTYGVGISDEYMQEISTMTAEEQQAIQLLLASTMVLNPDGTLTYTIAGQSAGGTWKDNGDGTVTMSIQGGNTTTFTYSNGMIYDPNQMETYFIRK